MSIHAISYFSDIVKGMKVDKGVHSIKPTSSETRAGFFSKTVNDSQHGQRLPKNYGYLAM